MNTLVGVLLVLHGIAHSLGFVAAWQLSAEVAYKTTIMGGRVDVGDTGIRILGLLWLLIAAAFVFAGILTMLGHPAWLPAALGAATASIVLCATELPDARVGLVLSTAIMIALLAATRMGIMT